MNLPYKLIDRKKNWIVMLETSAGTSLCKKRSPKRINFFGRINGRILINGFVHGQFNINVESWGRVRSSSFKKSQDFAKLWVKNYFSEQLETPNIYQGKEKGSWKHFVREAAKTCGNRKVETNGCNEWTAGKRCCNRQCRKVWATCSPQGILNAGE